MTKATTITGSQLLTMPRAAAVAARISLTTYLERRKDKKRHDRPERLRDTVLPTDRKAREARRLAAVAAARATADADGTKPEYVVLRIKDHRFVPISLPPLLLPENMLPPPPLYQDYNTWEGYDVRDAAISSADLLDRVPESCYV